MFHKQFLAWLAALSTLAAVHAAIADEVADVRSCYDDYKKAILAQDGATAVAKVDSRTLAYYGRIRTLALTAPAADVRKLPLMDKLMVLSVRHRVPVKDLKAMNEKAMFVYAVDKGWIGKESVQTNEIGEITVTGDKAVGNHVAKGIVTPLKMPFYKEEGEWKFNLTETMPAIEKAFGKVAAESGKTEDEFLVWLLHLTTDREVQESVWEPLAPEDR